MRYLLAIVCLCALLAGGARAGTTGAIVGRVVDRTDGRPLAGARVTAASPSQTMEAVTDASGAFAFASLAPDTYVVRTLRTGYRAHDELGVTVFADQARSLVVELAPALATIAKVAARASSLVRPGTTSDVYSVNAPQAQAATGLTGSGSLNQAYAAIASVPGVVVPQGQQGWYQFVYIRGGAQDQDGWELDGIPVNRAYDNAPQTMLSGLGQQELQVYTGGTPATSDASGLAGYVNQVVKTGTSPGYATASLSLGSPTFYHSARFEIGGATPDRRFSYYFGTLGADQGYRYLNQSNGAASPGFFYPLDVPTNNGYVYDGSAPALFSPGNAYGIASSQDRETIANVHLAIPHRRGTLGDDVQLLYDTGGIADGFYSSIDDLGAASVKAAFGPLHWADGVVYTGTPMLPVKAQSFATYFFPDSPAPRAPDAPIGTSMRDTNANGVSIVKLQYQHNMSSSAFVRLFGYTLYSNWFEYGPVSANLPWGDAVADYENVAHTGGLDATLVDQIDGRHLLTVGGLWTSSTMMRYSTTGGFPSASTGYYDTNFVGSNGSCYNWSTGEQIGCYDTCYLPTGGPGGAPTDRIGGSCSGPGDVALRATPPPLLAQPPSNALFTPPPAYSCTGPSPPPACAAHPQWLATETGYRANLDTVSPLFTAVALSDYWSPSDRLSADLGLRVENYDDRLANTQNGYPARAFWFSSYNSEFCFGAGLAVPVARNPTRSGGLLGSCPSGTKPVDMVDTSGGNLSSTQWQPRIAASYAMGSDDVLRGSWGVYAQPALTAWTQFNTVQQDLASYLGTEFLGYGFNTPVHSLVPARSYNADLSWEHRVRGAPIEFKVTPFYRSTADQLQSFDINPLTGLRSGLNVGHQVSAGVEFQAQIGDPARDGLSGLVSLTYTHSAIRYGDFSSGRNVIDNLNAYIQQYNSYTKACVRPNPQLCGTYTGNARAAFSQGGIVVANPYYDRPAQPLLDRNGWFAVYDVIPAPFTGANGHETPSVGSIVATYKRGKFALTPTVAISSGAQYGSPLVWPGYVPQFCTKVYPGTHVAIGSSCAGGPSTVAPLPYIFTPDPYTGSFDSLGAFRQPARLTVSLQMSYDVSPRIKAHVALLDLVDRCFLRGYAWENPGICVYAELPSSALAPVGNFVPPAQAPPQLRYPYGMWLNNTEVGALGTAVPFQAVFSIDVAL
ncbi:MAG TPA: TonB-dependent receptor [Candidatus Baltobacteraceae bacterium]|nr:TonB-dependent receptor [Candidatus Baltobacteraceae bacterium]